MATIKSFIVLPQYIYLKRSASKAQQHQHFVEYKWNPCANLCLLTRQGRVGHDGHTYTKNFADIFKIQKELLKRIKHKIAEGFLPFGCNMLAARKPTASMNKSIKLDTQRFTSKLDTAISKEKQQKKLPRVQSPSKFLAEKRRSLLAKHAAEQESPKKKRTRQQVEEDEDDMDTTHVTPILPRKRRRISLTATSTAPTVLNDENTTPTARRLNFDQHATTAIQPEIPTTFMDHDDDDDYGASIGFGGADDDDDTSSDLFATPLQPTSIFSQAESNATYVPAQSQDARKLELENQELLIKISELENRLHGLQQSVDVQQQQLALEATKLKLNQEACDEKWRDLTRTKDDWNTNKMQQEAALQETQQHLQVKQQELTMQSSKLEQDLQEQSRLQNTLHELRDRLYAQEGELNKKQQDLQTAWFKHEQTVAEHQAQMNQSKQAFEQSCEQERQIAKEWQDLRTQLANHEQQAQVYQESKQQDLEAMRKERAAMESLAEQVKLQQNQLLADRLLFAKQQEEFALCKEDERLRKLSVEELSKTCEAFVANTRRIASKRRDMYKTQQSEMQQAISKMFHHLQEADATAERELYNSKKMDLDSEDDAGTPTPTTAKKLQEIWDTQATLTLSK